MKATQINDEHRTDVLNNTMLASSSDFKLEACNRFVQYYIVNISHKNTILSVLYRSNYNTTQYYFGL